MKRRYSEYFENFDHFQFNQKSRVDSSLYPKKEGKVHLKK